ncbi:unnamed protein product [Discula destructiva]
MTIFFHIIRHGEAFHNLDPAETQTTPSLSGDNVPDPELTPLGIVQCRALGHRIGPLNRKSVNLVVASPLKRALYSAHFTFRDLIHEGFFSAPVAAFADLQEIGNSPAHIGSTVKALNSEFAILFSGLDTANVPEGWNSKHVSSDYEGNDHKIRERAERFKLEIKKTFLKADLDVNVFVFTHGLFINYLVGDEDKCA